jgi:Sugar (and other) transporter
MFYAPDILSTFFTEEAAIQGTFILNLINFLATFITVMTVEKYGRVKLLVCGASSCLPRSSRMQSCLP